MSSSSSLSLLALKLKNAIALTPSHQVFTHVKSQTQYRVIGVVLDEKTTEPLVIYRLERGDTKEKEAVVWARDQKEFLARFV